MDEPARDVATQIQSIAAGELLLEPQVAAHAEAMFAVLSDPAIYQYENAPPRSLDWLRDRFTKLETRRSPEHHEIWLNWVIRLPSSELIGYVQATVGRDGNAMIAYELSSRHWGRGLAGQAVAAMIERLAGEYGVHEVCAILKRENLRSMRLLMRLGFAPASPSQQLARNLEADEALMFRQLRPA